MSKVAVTDDEVGKFLEEVGQEERLAPRLVFAVDATASRQPAWDHACHVQAQMFEEAGRLGGLEVQLVYYRGHGECRASRWVASASLLVGLMTGITCRAGHTQARKVLSHCVRENRKQKVSALVFVGDMLEERPDEVMAEVPALVEAGVRCFMFQEGDRPDVAEVFGRVARATGGAHCRFDLGSPEVLRNLLGAVAAFAAGGAEALADLRTPEARLLSHQVH